MAIAFAIHAEGKIHAAKQPRHGVGRNLDIELPQQFGDSYRRLVGPANTGDGIAGGVVFQQDFDGIELFRPPADARSNTCNRPVAGCR